MFDNFSGSSFLIRWGIRSIIHSGLSLILLVGFLGAYLVFPGFRELFSPEIYPDAGPLELPEELVLGQASAPMDWCEDPANGGLLLVTNASGDEWNPVRRTERLDAPWKECMAVERDALDLLGGASRDARFSARIGRGKDNRGSLTVFEAGMEKVAAVVEPYAAGANSKFVLWHPKTNVLAAAGGDQITLVGEPDWRAKSIKTASRDFEEWKRAAQTGEEETGYHPHEMASHILSSADGALLICAMDQGIRVYSWEKVLRAEKTLPPPECAVDGEVVRLNRFAAFRMTYTAAYDEARHWVLWTGLEGTLDYLDLGTKTRGTLLRLPKGYPITRMQFLDSGKVLACEIHKLASQSSEGQGLYLLDYTRLVEAQRQN
jgi:hypothetical protein